MLSAILPGFRHVRTPLVAGALYLIAIWLWTEPFLSSAIVAETETVRRLTVLTTFVGTPISYAGLAIAAYLIGSFGEWASIKIHRRTLGQQPLSQRSWNAVTSHVHRISSNVEKRVRDFVCGEVDELLAAGLTIEATSQSSELPHRFKLDLEEAKAGWAEPATNYAPEDWPDEADRGALVRTTFLWIVRNDYEVMVVQLREQHPDLWNDYDRLRSESAFRLSIIIPSLFIAIAFVTMTSLVFVLLLSVPIALLVAGYRRQRRADYQIWNLLLKGVIHAPILVELREVANETSTPATKLPAPVQRDGT